ncbi:hypothetical protein DSO57_1028132 [Entomophthora muscae]|uniref:Uncharacterized protein n=1 Tax=Entomophthora muscae TaxID=34485 RepID=A0ACC2RSR1_9FUNG|nr:hypothetical protein DSO57_1028132 [Entomophthora muscae]
MNLWFNKILLYLALIFYYLHTTFTSPAALVSLPSDPADSLTELFCLTGALFCKVLWPTFGPELECISQTIKKVARVQAKPLQNLEDLAHTVDELFVLAFLAEVPISPLDSPPTAEETLIQLDCLLSWCCPVLKQLAGQQKNEGCMNPEKHNLRPGEIGYQIPQSVVSQAANSPGPEVPQPKIIGFWSSPMETSEEGISGNVHPESSEGS